MSISPYPSEEKVVVTESPFEKGKVSQGKLKLDADPSEGSIDAEVVQHKHFSAVDISVCFKHDVILTPPSPGETPHFGLAVMQSNSGTSRFADGDWFDVYRGEGYLTYNPCVEESHRVVANVALNVRYLEIPDHYMLPLLAEFSPDRNTPFWDFKEKVFRNDFGGIGAKIAMPEYHQALNNIFNCQFNGPLGAMMLEGSIQQLLAMQFSMLGSQSPSENIPTYNKEVFHAIRDYLNDTYLEVHSLFDLSRKFGINQNKLKNGFRTVFGTPVIAYIFSLRMAHARTLLYDMKMHVNEVAPIVGYRNAHHFSTAFKRQFGISPSVLRRV